MVFYVAYKSTQKLPKSQLNSHLIFTGIGLKSYPTTARHENLLLSSIMSRTIHVDSLSFPQVTAL